MAVALMRHYSHVDERQVQLRYICNHLPEQGDRIYFDDINEDGERIFADLLPLYDSDTDSYELIIETNDRGYVGLDEVHRTFRCREKSIQPTAKDSDQSVVRYFEGIRQACDRPTHPRVAFQQALSQISPTQRELWDSASETVPVRAERLAKTAGHDCNGHIKGSLRVLVLLGLLVKRPGGYLRAQWP